MTKIKNNFFLRQYTGQEKLKLIIKSDSNLKISTSLDTNFSHFRSTKGNKIIKREKKKKKLILYLKMFINER